MTEEQLKIRKMALQAAREVGINEPSTSKLQQFAELLFSMRDKENDMVSQPHGVCHD